MYSVVFALIYRSLRMVYIPSVTSNSKLKNAQPGGPPGPVTAQIRKNSALLFCYILGSCPDIYLSFIRYIYLLKLYILPHISSCKTNVFNSFCIGSYVGAVGIYTNGINENRECHLPPSLVKEKARCRVARILFAIRPCQHASHELERPSIEPSDRALTRDPEHQRAAIVGLCPRGSKYDASPFDVIGQFV
jgi:hypothetical protein